MIENHLHNMSLIEKFNAIREWEHRKAPKNFSLDFVDSLENQYWEKNQLTEKQEKALDSIIVKWGVLDE